MFAPTAPLRRHIAAWAGLRESANLQSTYVTARLFSVPAMHLALEAILFAATRCPNLWETPTKLEMYCGTTLGVIDQRCDASGREQARQPKRCPAFTSDFRACFFVVPCRHLRDHLGQNICGIQLLPVVTLNCIVRAMPCLSTNFAENILLDRFGIVEVRQLVCGEQADLATTPDTE